MWFCKQCNNCTFNVTRALYEQRLLARYAVVKMKMHTSGVHTISATVSVE